jgi:signal transduction histidine kinase
MIDSMLEISLLESEQIQIKPNNFNSFELKTKIEEIIEQELWRKSKNINFKVECTKNFEIYSDKDRVYQIIQEIIDNAVKFTESGIIKAYVYNSNYSVNIEIQDTGIGIENKNIKYIFDRFYKIESNDKFYRGVGLGLSICKEIVKLLHGEILVSSEVYKGTTFKIKIPSQ